MFILVVYSKNQGVKNPRIFAHEGDDEVEAMEWVGAELGEAVVYDEDTGVGESANYTYEASLVDRAAEIFF